MSWAESKWILNNQAAAGIGTYDRILFEYDNEIPLSGTTLNRCICKLIVPENGLYKYSLTVKNKDVVSSKTIYLQMLILDLHNTAVTSTGLFSHGQNQSHINYYKNATIGSVIGSLGASSSYEVSKPSSVNIGSAFNLTTGQERTFEHFIKGKKGDIFLFVCPGMEQDVVVKSQKISY